MSHLYTNSKFTEEVEIIKVQENIGAAEKKYLYIATEGNSGLSH